MIDPEELTFVQLFWLFFGLIIAVVLFCRWVDMNWVFTH